MFLTQGMERIRLALLYVYFEEVFNHASAYFIYTSTGNSLMDFSMTLVHVIHGSIFYTCLRYILHNL